MTRIALEHMPVLVLEFAEAAGQDPRGDPGEGGATPSAAAWWPTTAAARSTRRCCRRSRCGCCRPRIRTRCRRSHAIREDLDDGGWLKRYRTDDGFGRPDVAFSLCTFWLIEALARLGLDADARAALERVRDIKSPLGLLSEDVKPSSGEMWGNFPQAYSHVGLIHAAFAAAPRWGEYGS